MKDSDFNIGNPTIEQDLNINGTAHGLDGSVYLYLIGHKSANHTIQISNVLMGDSSDWLLLSCWTLRDQAKAMGVTDEMITTGIKAITSDEMIDKAINDAERRLAALRGARHGQ